MPLTVSSTAITEVRNVQTIYPTCFIRNAHDVTAYLDHADPRDPRPNQVRVGNIDHAKAWKLDKDNHDPNLLISSDSRGVALTYHLDDVLYLDPRRESTMKWKIERAEAGRFRLSGDHFDIKNKYWTLDVDRKTVSLENPIGEDATVEQKLKQQWVFETIIV